MKFVQYVTGAGANAYIRADRIIRITDEGADCARVLLDDPAGTEMVLRIKSIELISQLQNSRDQVIMTDSSTQQTQAARRFNELLSGIMPGLQSGPEQKDEEAD